jgi:hypothetical protein
MHNTHLIYFVHLSLQDLEIFGSIGLFLQIMRRNGLGHVTLRHIRRTVCRVTNRGPGV